MKPRHIPEPPTLADCSAWLHFAWRWRRRHGHYCNPDPVRDADRRDADVMLALGTLHIATGGDFSPEARAGRRRMYQGFMAHPHALGFVWMPGRLAAMREKP